MAYNYKMANKGKGLEDMIILQNQLYQNRGVANVQKIPTPWQVIRDGKRIISAFPREKSTLDFRGTVYPRIPISFDAKECMEVKGLPLSYIKPHQIEYMRGAIRVKEITFIICEIKPSMQRFVIDGITCIEYWDRWQMNKNKRGYNYIPVSAMKRIVNMDNQASIIDYLGVALSNA